MVAIAFPAIEAIAVRVLTALGVGIVAKRQEEADKAKSEPIARTDVITAAREKCKECPPDHGALVPVNYHMPPNSMEYQARITGFPPGMEWAFEGRDFDGFKSDMCLLQEAKADYDQFFDQSGRFRYIFQQGIFIKMETQARAQAKIVSRNTPTALTYYFQTPIAYEYMTPKLVVLGIAVLHIP